MKKLLFFTAILAVILFIMPAQVRAQNYTVDTVDIAALPAGNINTVINGDTLNGTGGLRAHPNRVYRLKPGAVYQVTEPMTIYGNLILTSRDTTANVRPPVLAPAILPDNTSIDHFFQFPTNGSIVEMHNVYFISVRADGAQLGWSDGLRISGDSVKLKLRGCIFDAFTDCALKITAQWLKMDVQDCKFRNLQHSSAYFGGQAILTDGGNDMDTCKIINNTFFCCNSYIFSVRGYDRYAEFSHNTVVYGAVNPLLISSAPNIHMNNNLFYASHGFGGIPEEIIGCWFDNFPDTTSSAIVTISALDTISAYYRKWIAVNPAYTITGPEVYINATHGVTSAMVDPSLRVYELKNNDFVNPDKLVNYYTNYNDTVASKDSIDLNGSSKGYMLRKLYLPKWMTDYTQWTIDTLLKKESSNITIGTTLNDDPGFNTSIVNQADKLMSYVGKICTSKLDSTWFYKPSGSIYPPVWPLPEDLTYSNTTLQAAGTDGFALGDLNWYPTQKAQWLTDVKVDKGSQIPVEFSLSNAYPNPFNPTTNIKFNLAKAENVRLVVFNILGQKIRTLVNGDMKAGAYTATWDGKDQFGAQVASGIYIYRLESQSFSATKKMILMK